MVTPIYETISDRLIQEAALRRMVGYMPGCTVAFTHKLAGVDGVIERDGRVFGVVEFKDRDVPDGVSTVFFSAEKAARLYMLHVTLKCRAFYCVQRLGELGVFEVPWAGKIGADISGRNDRLNDPKRKEVMLHVPLRGFWWSPQEGDDDGFVFPFMSREEWDE
jgi:hypothetical protein